MLSKVSRQERRDKQLLEKEVEKLKGELASLQKNPQITTEQADLPRAIAVNNPVKQTSKK